MDKRKTNLDLLSTHACMYNVYTRRTFISITAFSLGILRLNNTAFYLSNKYAMSILSHAQITHLNILIIGMGKMNLLNESNHLIRLTKMIRSLIHLIHMIYDSIGNLTF